MAQVPDDPSILLPIFQQMKTNVHAPQLRSLKFREEQLRRLAKAIVQFKPKLNQALNKDLGYDDFLATMLSHGSVESQIDHTIKNFKGWLKPEHIQTPLSMGWGHSYVQQQPYGLVLVLAAWNYPVATGIPYVATAIAAGNCVIFKPSEFAAHTSNVMREMFQKYMDNRFYRVIQGKVEVAKTLVSMPFDLIAFTGSTATGRLVAMSASKNLVPYILELGGKCPIIIDETGNLESAATRIAFAKNMNCGQTCVGADHVFVHKNVKQQFTKKLIAATKRLYGQNLTESNAMGKIIAPIHVNRLERLLKDDHKGKVLLGGKIHHDSRFIEPTIVDSPSQDSLMMKQQIFGPILPIFQYDNLDHLIKLLNSKPKPLAVYVFSEHKTTRQKIKNQTSSGAYVVNDLVIQSINVNLPFGGVGHSGTGRVRGKKGFQNFCNPKSVMYTTCDDSFPASARFPPYTEKSKKTLGYLMGVGKITYSSIARGLTAVIALLVLAVAFSYIKDEL